MSKGPLVEKALIDEGVIKFYKDNFDRPNNDKQWYWKTNKNIMGDGLIDSKMVQMMMLTKTPPLQTYGNPSQEPYVNPSPSMQVNLPYQACHNPQQQAQHTQKKSDKCYHSHLGSPMTNRT